MDNDALRLLPLFASLTPDDATSAISHFVPGELGAGELLVAEGEPDRSMLLMVKGEVSVFAGNPGVELARVGPGEVIGEMALLGVAGRRAASVRTLTPCQFLVLEWRTLERLRRAGHPVVASLEYASVVTLARRLRDMDERITALAEGTPLRTGRPQGLLARLAAAFGGRSQEPPVEPAPSPTYALQSSPAFWSLQAEPTRVLAQAMDLIALPAGRTLIVEGADDADAYVIASGTVAVYRATEAEKYDKVATLGVGTLFGLVSLVDRGPRTATCVTEDPCWLLRLTPALYDSVIREDTLEGRVLRRGLIEALSSQLRGANTRVESLVRAQAGLSTMDEGAVSAVQAARAAISALEGRPR